MDQPNFLMGLNATISARAVGRSTHLADVKSGLWTKPVQASAGRIAWPAAEVSAQLAARIAGRSTDEIRRLVRQLEDARKSAAKGAN